MFFQNYLEFGAPVGKLQVINNLPVLSQQQCLSVFPHFSKGGMQFCAGKKGNDLAFILQWKFPQDFLKV